MMMSMDDEETIMGQKENKMTDPEQSRQIPIGETTDTPTLENILGDLSPSEQRALTISKATRELERCNRLYQTQHYEEAERGYRELIESREDDKVLANLGYTLQALGRHQEAVVIFERYLKVFMARHHAWKALCFSYYHLEDYENMTRCAREAIMWDIRHDSPDDYSWQQMATAHFLMNDLSTALKAARKSIAINPQNAFSLYYEACILAAIVKGAEFDQPELLVEPPSYEEAAERLCLALEARPDLKEELAQEGYLDEVFPLADKLLVERKAERLRQAEAESAAKPEEVTEGQQLSERTTTEGEAITREESSEDD